MKPRMNMKPYVVTRTVRGAPTAGRYASGSTSTVNITADVQPYQDGKKQSAPPLPEGVRTSDVRRIFTSTELLVGNANFEADTLTIRGDRFEVYACAEWNSDHFECYAARQERP